MRGGGVPGVGYGWVAGEGYTGYYPAILPGPYLVIFQPQGTTYGQMKAILEVS